MIPRPTRGDNVLEVRGLKTEFHTQDGVVRAIDNLSFDVGTGEIVGLVGESGCGKSTAALSITRLIPKPGRIVDGAIIVDGQDVVPLSDQQMRRLRGPTIAMVFQDSLTALDPTMKVGKQMSEPLQTHLGMSGRAARERAAELFALVGIPSPHARLDQYPHQFSGGMRQRVMIAIALSCNPRLLLADEPTTALDVSVQRQILSLMERLRDDSGAGIVLITHDVDVVAQVCDRVVVMYAGKVMEAGPTEQVFREPQHPYTIGLLESTLGHGPSQGNLLRAIPGFPPDLTNLPPGCPFWPRCRRRTEECTQTMPRIELVSPQHQVACWHRGGAE